MVFQFIFEIAPLLWLRLLCYLSSIVSLILACLASYRACLRARTISPRVLDWDVLRADLPLCCWLCSGLSAVWEGFFACLGLMYEARECCLLCLIGALGLFSDDISTFAEYVGVGLRLIKFDVKAGS